MESDEENTPPVKLEKAKEEGARSRARKSASREDSVNASGSTPPRKRARLQPADEPEEGADEDEKEGDEEDGAVPQEAGDIDEEDPYAEVRYQRDENGYMPGSIVRFAAHNFLTYDNVEFRPGPSLNMVIGPNGSGKSSIAAGIAIGLGFPPKVLGKATQLRQYVKNDTTEGWVELELKGLPNEENTTIRRHLNADNDQTSFVMDGETSTAKEVGQRMKQLNIQVDNLCTFLPQERVASFAAMAPPTLLKETQKAAGSAKLPIWHNQLIKLKTEHVRVKAELETNTEALTRRKNKQAETEREVQQFEARKKLEEDIAVLELLIPYAEFAEARSVWTAAKEQRNELTNEVQELEVANAPFMEARGILSTVVSQYNDLRKGLDKKQTTVGKQIKETETALAKCEKDVETVRENLSSLKKTEKDRVTTIAKLERDVARYAKAIEKRPENPDLSDINAKGNELSKQKAGITTQQQEAAELHRDCEQQAARLKREEATIKERGQRAENLANIKLDQCRKFEESTYQAILWLRENRGRLKGVVHEPPRVCCSIKDPRNTKLAEATVSKAALKTFVFEEREDYDWVMRELADKRGLRINGAEVGQYRTLQEVKQNNRVSEQTLRNWGFDCWAIDLFEGPEVVLAWLATTHSLGSYPVTTNANARIQSDAVEQSGLINRYYTPQQSYSMKKSNYGARQVLVETRTLEEAKVFTGVNVDPEAVDRLKRELAEVRAKLVDVKKRFDENVVQQDELRERAASIEHEKSDLARERSALNKPLKEFLEAEAKHKSATTSLAREKAKPSQEQKRDDLRKKMILNLEKRVELVIKHKELLFKSVKITFDVATVQLRHLQYENDLRAMDSSAKEKDAELVQKQAQLKILVTKTKELHIRAKNIIEQANENLETVTPAQKKRVQDDDKSRKLEDLQQELEQNQTAIAMTQAISPHVLEQHKKRKKEIEQLDGVVREGTDQLEGIGAQIDEVEALWLPRLEKLVTNVSENFSSIFDFLGLLGEVRLARHEDYDKWGIEILVSFRDGEELQPLTNQRQSGGERALTTVMYLMSLAELAKAPFALVDEINQGMDQRVERTVHNALVRTTCQSEIGQYFLITPKLLPNLNYDPKMKVLVVNTGQWIPDKLSLRDIVDRKILSNRNV